MEALKLRAEHLYFQLLKTQETIAHDWLVERESLEAQAASLTEALNILNAHHQSLQDSLTTSPPRDFHLFQSSFSVGFNASLSDLRDERDRLRHALQQLETRLDQAKAEILKQHKADDREIWETQLIALQVSRQRHRVENCCST